MADPGTLPIVQINLHHSKSASAILARCMTEMQTCIALIQEPWILNNAIKGLGGCGLIYAPNSTDKQRTCIAVKGLNAIFMPQLSCGDLTVIRLNLPLDVDKSMDLLIGAVYMPYDAKDPPPQLEVRKLIEFAEERGVELLLGCDANDHHVA